VERDAEVRVLPLVWSSHRTVSQRDWWSAGGLPKRGDSFATQSFAASSDAILIQAKHGGEMRPAPWAVNGTAPRLSSEGRGFGGDDQDEPDGPFRGFVFWIRRQHPVGRCLGVDLIMMRRAVRLFGEEGGEPGDVDAP
jgi:hypothetical protein